MPLRVLYSYPNRLGATGIGAIAWHQVRGLLSRGMRVTAIVGSCERELPDRPTIHQTMQIGPWRLPYRVVGRDRAFDWHDRRAAGLLRNLAGEIDVVHCWPQAALRTLHVARELGVPSVLERPNTHTAYAYEVVRREYDALGLEMPPGYLHASDATRLAKEQQEYELADQLACPSRFVAKTFFDRGFAPAKLGVHQYGCDPSQFHTGHADSDRPFRAAFVASGDPRKGVHLLLDAWQRAGLVGKAELLVCGKFQPAYRGLLASRLAQAGVRELGFVDNSTVANQMRDCDVFVLPSIEEGSALVTYEARCCGCVLVVSDATGAVVTHDHDGLVHPAGDVAALAAHLRMLFDDRALLARLRRNSLAGLNELTWDRAAERLESVYHRALGMKREPVFDEASELVVV